MTISRDPILEITPNYAKGFIVVKQRNSSAGIDYQSCFSQWEWHLKFALALSDQVYYVDDSGIWTFIPAKPFAICRQIYPSRNNISALFCRENQLYYQLAGHEDTLQCDINQLPIEKQRLIVMASSGLVFDIRFTPVSLSGRHFACHNGKELLFITLKDQYKLQCLRFPYNSASVFYQFCAFNHEQNCFLLIEENRVRFLQFTENEIHESAAIQMKDSGLSLGTFYNRQAFSVMDGRHFIMHNNRDGSRLLLIDLMKGESRNIYPKNLYHPNWRSITKSGSYLIITGEDLILVFHQDNCVNKNFFAIPDAEFHIPGVCNVVAWPYDPERGQLWAIAHYGSNHKYQYRPRAKLILARYKQGHPLEKIMDIEAGLGIDEPCSLFIANNLLYFQHVREDVFHNTYAAAFDPENNCIWPYKKIPRVYQGHGTPFGAYFFGQRDMEIVPYPTAENFLFELQALADALPFFSMDLVKIAASYLGYYIFQQSKSVPPADIIRTPEETAMLAKVDTCLDQTKNDKSVHAALRKLKTRLLCRTLSYRDCIREVEDACEDLKPIDTSVNPPPSFWFFGFFSTPAVRENSPLLQKRKEVRLLLDEIRGCDKLAPKKMESSQMRNPISANLRKRI